MTRKDYRALAGAIAWPNAGRIGYFIELESPNEVEDEFVRKADIVIEIAKVLARSNPRFDGYRFGQACYGNDCPADLLLKLDSL